MLLACESFLVNWLRVLVKFKNGYYGAVAKLGGEPRRPSFSFPDGRCVPAFSGRLEDPVDDHRVRIGVPISKHRALTFP